MTDVIGAEIETVSDYYAAVRASQLKPTNVPTVYTDPSGAPWYVDDPSDKTPAQRREGFALLLFNRGLGPPPFKLS
jgi:hypothetical protein